MFKSRNPQSGWFHDTNDQRGLGCKTEKIRTPYHLFGWNRQYLKPPSKSSLINIPILVLAIDIYIICVQCSLPYGHHIHVHMCVALISSTCMKPFGFAKNFVYHGIIHKPKLHFHSGTW